MEDIDHFYSRVISWDNLIQRGYFNITKDKGYKDLYSLLNNPYAKYDSLFAGYFNLKGLIENKTAYQFVKNSIQNLNLVKDINKKRIKPTIPILYTIPKDSNVRRPLKYPNFYSYCILVNELTKDTNKQKIIYQLKNDKHSMSKFFTYKPYDYEVTHRMQDYVLIGHSYFFKTDFSTFYHSFYTHARAWLIEKKDNAKKHRNLTYFGNMVDKLIEFEQDAETHGVPTGNLVTNIVMEYAMSFFDKELEDRLSKTTVDFYRYVDDIYFGYDDPKDLIEIKRTLQDLTVKYAIELNNTKTKSISYNEINRSSQLLDYFANIKIRKIESIERFSKIFNNFFAIANEEILSGIKGSKKLLFSSLQYFLHSLSKLNKKNALKALIKTTSDVEFPFILKIIQLALNDSRIAERFIHLLEEIQKEEKDIWPQDENERIVSVYLHKIFERDPLNSRLNYQLLHCLRENKSEEAYFIFVLMQKLEWNLSIEQLARIMNISSRNGSNQVSDDYLVQIDDFNWLMILENLIIIMNKENNASSNVAILCKAIEKIDSILSQTDVNNYFGTKHWLLKYELIYIYEYGDTKLNKYVDDFYSSSNNKNIFDISTFENNPSNSKVNKFFIGLLNNGYSFSG